MSEKNFNSLQDSVEDIYLNDEFDYIAIEDETSVINIGVNLCSLTASFNPFAPYVRVSRIPRWVLHILKNKIAILMYLIICYYKCKTSNRKFMCKLFNISFDVNSSTGLTVIKDGKFVKN